ncbi:5'-nucleotidase [Salvia divinorum]|uniref:5'-nucleotidase n=1 Tax=Salvia divinorum TaxID=28513 RepID=A0ABD1GMP5_SALDI
MYLRAIPSKVNVLGQVFWAPSIYSGTVAGAREAFLQTYLLYLCHDWYGPEGRRSADDYELAAEACLS